MQPIGLKRMVQNQSSVLLQARQLLQDVKWGMPAPSSEVKQTLLPPKWKYWQHAVLLWWIHLLRSEQRWRKLSVKTKHSTCTSIDIDLSIVTRHHDPASTIKR